MHWLPLRRGSTSLSMVKDVSTKTCAGSNAGGRCRGLDNRTPRHYGRKCVDRRGDACGATRQYWEGAHSYMLVSPRMECGTRRQCYARVYLTEWEWSPSYIRLLGNACAVVRTGGSGDHASLRFARQRVHIRCRRRWRQTPAPGASVAEAARSPESARLRKTEGQCLCGGRQMRCRRSCGREKACLTGVTFMGAETAIAQRCRHHRERARLSPPTLVHGGSVGRGAPIRSTARRYFFRHGGCVRARRWCRERKPCQRVLLQLGFSQQAPKMLINWRVMIWYPRDVHAASLEAPLFRCHIRQVRSARSTVRDHADRQRIVKTWRKFTSTVAASLDFSSWKEERADSRA